MTDYLLFPPVLITFFLFYFFVPTLWPKDLMVHRGMRKWTCGPTGSLTFCWLCVSLCLFPLLARSNIPCNWVFVLHLLYLHGSGPQLSNLYFFKKLYIWGTLVCSRRWAGQATGEWGRRADILVLALLEPCLTLMNYFLIMFHGGVTTPYNLAG